MKSVKIICKMEAGEKALRKEIEDTLKLSKRVRKQFERSFSKEVICTAPFTVYVSIKDKMMQDLLNKDDFLAGIRRALKENGAEENIDYTFEVE